MNIKYSIIAGLLSTGLGFGALTLPANARVDFQIYFGVPHYGYQVEDDYIFRRGYGWYRPIYRDRFRDRLSCGEARRLVRNHGYRNVVTRECNGSTYTFRATRRGNSVVIYVNARSGRIWRA